MARANKDPEKGPILWHREVALRGKYRATGRGGQHPSLPFPLHFPNNSLTRTFCLEFISASQAKRKWRGLGPGLMEGVELASVFPFWSSEETVREASFALLAEHIPDPTDPCWGARGAESKEAEEGGGGRRQRKEARVIYPAAG